MRGTYVQGVATGQGSGLLAEKVSVPGVLLEQVQLDEPTVVVSCADASPGVQARPAAALPAAASVIGMLERSDTPGRAYDAETAKVLGPRLVEVEMICWVVATTKGAAWVMKRMEAGVAAQVPDV
jgi:hypothetical protein